MGSVGGSIERRWVFVSVGICALALTRAYGQSALGGPWREQDAELTSSLREELEKYE
jgi:hypothetical protein